MITFARAITHTDDWTHTQAITHTHRHTQYHTLNYSDPHTNTLTQCVTDTCSLCLSKAPPSPQRKHLRVRGRGSFYCFLWRACEANEGLHRRVMSEGQRDRKTQRMRILHLHWCGFSSLYEGQLHPRSHCVKSAQREPLMANSRAHTIPVLDAHQLCCSHSQLTAS